MNILIVDDEIQICRWFEMLIRKTGLEIEIAGICSNGQDALEACRNEAVDIVFTDIKMPVMDGITLIKQLKREFPSIRTLILSAYGEFSFASEALKSGASDYVLKAEVTVDSLREVILKIQRDLEMEQKRNHEVQVIKSKLNQNQYELRALYFKKLMEGDAAAAERLEAEKEFLGFSLHNKHLILLAISVDEYPQILHTGKIRTRELLNLAVINILDETLQYEAGSGCSFLAEENVYVAVFNTRQSGNKSLRESTYQFVHRISSHLSDYLGLSVSIGISLSYSDMSRMGKQLTEAVSALQEKRFYGKRVIAWHEEMAQSTRGKEEGFNLSECTAAIERRDYAGVGEAIQSGLKSIGARQLLSAKEVKSQALGMIYFLQHQLGRVGINQKKARLDAGAPHEEIRRMDTFQEIKDWLTAKADNLLKESAASMQPYSEPVTKSLQLIQSAYADDISLSQIAEQVHLNKTYLSELFKKEVGTSFNDYLTQIRIDRAKEMILAGKRMSILAEQVGYPNASYFTKVFKKVTGMTPGEYKSSAESGS
ncbi:response regulator transcription factor [Paenibacillus sp. SAF-054]|uniref:response regulator transcription factor n=1 Tax=unclassified Paenibacillus TaxID=185978 RepID=UPI003F7D8590